MSDKTNVYLPAAPSDSREADEIKTHKDSGSGGSGSLAYTPKPIRRKGSIRPIILSLLLVIGFGKTNLQAQLTGNLSLGAGWTDNVFQLSESDLDRFNENHSSLAFAETTDDLSLSTRLELGYPLSYRWWKFTPGIVAQYSQNLSNTDKYRTDAAFKLRIDRYYWNAILQYAYNPHIYYRDFTDSDGSGNLENYSYSRNAYRVDAAVKPNRKATIKANLRQEDYYYSEFFTEADGSALTGGLALNYRFPAFTLEAGYDYRDFSNDNKIDDDDSSYQSNIYKGRLTMPRMPLNENGKAMWQPALGLNYEQRYYQGAGSWYGGRADYTYTLTAGFDIFPVSKWNLSLDYSHIFRNVESDNESLIRLKEYSENRVSAGVRYKF